MPKSPEENPGPERRPNDRAGEGISRRVLLGRLAAISPLGLLASTGQAATPARAGPKRRMQRRIAVVGAGAFGGWTALDLLRRGAQVTLLDAWGPGNSRASSGGETRVIRGVYGPDAIYTEMVARAFRLWRENQMRWKKRFYFRTGALWMMTDEGEFVRAAMPILREQAFAFEELSAAEAQRRYPQIKLDGVKWALYEKEAGYLLARRACAQVLDGFVAEGGTYREVAASPGEIVGGTMKRLDLSDGASLIADAYVFACGPWMPKVFPDVIGDAIQPTRQDVFYLGTPAGDARFSEENLPVWVEVPRFLYGVPGNERRGFKIADDARGEPFDPTSGDRSPSAAALAAVREYVAMRFPALKGAPLLESRVCQYENSPDHHFIVDRHPGAANVWLVGGGSGHGFKHGPALGERVAQTVLGQRPIDPFFSLARLRKPLAAALAVLPKERI